MNNIQENYFDFIMEKVADENKDKVKELLSENFSRQENGTFTKEYMISVIPKMLELIKPEYIDEVKSIMVQHKAAAFGNE
ncbi:MAG: hypothetical protein K5986_09045 [Clostridium sp.]|uniref:hypothetical protein n=1 Tax=Clostridium sp. DSM 8431 TaxID=1761781 RepID=UPI0008F2910F|nr:hypothetical protein [Clostridium sp. DSM 8431]MCR4944576.1 hypothetical protein [Clostridium sp.]SFU33276.1 hypothetical protein SAMN04487886_100833 [Clostridium sp. DSM 8431]